LPERPGGSNSLAISVVRTPTSGVVAAGCSHRPLRRTRVVARPGAIQVPCYPYAVG
jgi:hypothetical protein